jgi:hypothetical protein
MTSSQTHALQIKHASNAAMASILNLTLLPIIGFIALILIYNKTQPGTIGRYHSILGMKINIIAATVLFVVSALMILLGGFDSPWTWVYVISYFTLVHTAFIIIALWALVRSWSGDKLKNTGKTA